MKNKMKNLKKWRKSTKGITLVALVVTIVILIIMAEVAITLILNSNGIVTKAEKASNDTKLEDVKEELTLKIADYQVNNINGNTQTFAEYLQSDENVTTIEGGNETNYDVIYKEYEFIINYETLEIISVEKAVPKPVIEYKVLNGTTDITDSKGTVTAGTKITINVRATIKDGIIKGITSTNGTATTSTIDGGLMGVLSINQNGNYNFTIEYTNANGTNQAIDKTYTIKQYETTIIGAIVKYTPISGTYTLTSSNTGYSTYKTGTIIKTINGIEWRGLYTENGYAYITPTAPISNNSITFYGKGVNSYITTLNGVCSALYSNSKLSATATSVTTSDETRLIALHKLYSCTQAFLEANILTTTTPEDYGRASAPHEWIKIYNGTTFTSTQLWWYYQTTYGASIGTYIYNYQSQYTAAIRPIVKISSSHIQENEDGTFSVI